MTQDGQGRPVRRFAQAAGGTAAVEFALLAPLYLVLLLGITGYGIYLGAAHSVQQIAADAARAAVAGLSDAERRAIAGSFVERNAGDYVLIDPARIEVDASANPDHADQFVVGVSYDAGNLPIWGLLGRVDMPGRIIVRRSTIRTGGM